MKWCQMLTKSPLNFINEWKEFNEENWIFNLSLHISKEKERISYQSFRNSIFVRKKTLLDIKDTNIYISI